MKIFHIPLAEYFIREAYFTFSQKRKYFTFGKAEYIGGAAVTQRISKAYSSNIIVFSKPSYPAKVSG